MSPTFLSLDEDCKFYNNKHYITTREQGRGRYLLKWKGLNYGCVFHYCHVTAHVFQPYLKIYKTHVCNPNNIDISTLEPDDDENDERNEAEDASDPFQLPDLSIKVRRSKSFPSSQIPSPPPIEDSLNESIDLAETFFLDPIFLTVEETIRHCVPSSHELRVMSEHLGIKNEPKNHNSWFSTLMIDEIRGNSTPTNTAKITMKQNFGFQALSWFLAGDEEATFEIQKAIKEYIWNQFLSTAASEYPSYSNLLINALWSSNKLQNTHLWAATKLLNIRIAIFTENESVKVFGDAFNDLLPSILLKKCGNEYFPVLNVKN